MRDIPELAYTTRVSNFNVVFPAKFLRFRFFSNSGKQMIKVEKPLKDFISLWLCVKRTTHRDWQPIIDNREISNQSS